MMNAIRRVLAISIFISNGLVLISGEPLTLPKYYHNYINKGFGFAISIPKGFSGAGDPSPYPNHGITIQLNKQSDATINIFATYNTADDNITVDSITEEDRRLKISMKATSYEVVFSGEVTIRGAIGGRIIAKYITSDKKEIIEDKIVFVGKKNRAIGDTIYSLILTSDPKRFVFDQLCFINIANNWRWVM